jgi:hypothetical protein
MGLWTTLELEFPKTTKLNEQKTFMLLLQYVANKEDFMWEATISDVEFDKFSMTFDDNATDDVKQELIDITAYLEQDPPTIIKETTQTPLG